MLHHISTHQPPRRHDGTMQGHADRTGAQHTDRRSRAGAFSTSTRRGGALPHCSPEKGSRHGAAWRRLGPRKAAGSKWGCRRGIAAAAALAAVVVADDGTVGGGARGAERAREIDPDHLTGLQPGDSENERQLRQTAPTGAGARHATKCMSPKPSQRRQRPGNKTHPQHADDADDVHVHGILLLALLIFFYFCY
jgi:hypothetical protein